MIRWLLRGISALIFLAGALAMVGGAVLTWVTLVLMIGKEIGPIAGLVVLFASFWAFERWQAMLRAPWQLWLELWRWADRRLD